MYRVYFFSDAGPEGGHFAGCSKIYGFIEEVLREILDQTGNSKPHFIEFYIEARKIPYL